MFRAKSAGTPALSGTSNVAPPLPPLTSQVIEAPLTTPESLDLHRYLGGLATVFVGVHVGAILLDSSSKYDLSVLPKDKAGALVFYFSNRL